MTPIRTSYIQSFMTPEATDVMQVGGKGAVLACLFQAGVPVPPGCIVTVSALTAYLEMQGITVACSIEDVRRRLLVKQPPVAMREMLRAIVHQIVPAPLGWAVRSSAVAEDSDTASFAGIYESVLQVDEANLWPAIQACWASWWSPRAIAYRQRLGDSSPLPHMAVVIQAMVSAHCAGVAFTADPISGDSTRMVIHAAPGLGTAVVAGAVQPEQHVLSKAPEKRVLQRRLWQSGQQPLLTSAHISVLGELLQRIEVLRGSPQDVEWVWDGRQYWIVQSRPITALASQATSGGEIVWSNANLKDVMPGLVSPFTWSLMRPQLEAAIRDQFIQVGYKVAPDCPIIRRFWGRPYFNFSLFQESAYDLYGAPPEQQVNQLGGAMVQGFIPDAAVPLRTRIRWLRNALRFSVIADRVRKAAPVCFDEVTRRWQTEIQQAPYLDRAAVLEKLETFAVLTRPFLLQHLDLSWAMSGNFSHLGELIKRWIPQARPGLIADLVTGIGDISSAEHSYRLWKLSRLARQLPEVVRFLQRGEWSNWRTELAGTPFATSWQAFLDSFGHRSLYEVEMANPRWREQPNYLFDVLSSYVTLNQEDIPFDPQEQACRRYVAECEVLGKLSPWRRRWFRLVLRRVQVFSRLRENSKSHLVKLVDIGRCMALAAASFLIQDGVLSDSESVFLLEIDEIKAALRHEKDAQQIMQQMTQRRLERQRYAALQPPEAIVGDRPFYEQPFTEQTRTLHGLPSSPGRVMGTARVLRLPQEGVRLNPGEILVAPSTDPGWTPLFLLAAGLVMETGGYLSHGAIVAREYGIPAVLNVAMATAIISDGCTVILDGGAGTVQVVAG